MQTQNFKSPVVRWIDHRLPVFSFMHHELHEYPTPKNLNYLWNLGSLAGLALVTMIVTGIILACTIRRMLTMRLNPLNASCVMLTEAGSFVIST